MDLEPSDESEAIRSTVVSEATKESMMASNYVDEVTMRRNASSAVSEASGEGPDSSGEESDSNPVGIRAISAMSERSMDRNSTNPVYPPELRLPFDYRVLIPWM